MSTRYHFATRPYLCTEESRNRTYCRRQGVSLLQGDLSHSHHDMMEMMPLVTREEREKLGLLRNETGENDCP